jgi:hypothetical protein
MAETGHDFYLQLFSLPGKNYFSLIICSEKPGPAGSFSP